jgi:hypothetical protein
VEMGVFLNRLVIGTTMRLLTVVFKGESGIKRRRIAKRGSVFSARTVHGSVSFKNVVE